MDTTRLNIATITEYIVRIIISLMFCDLILYYYLVTSRPVPVLGVNYYFKEYVNLIVVGLEKHLVA